MSQSTNEKIIILKLIREIFGQTEYSKSLKNFGKDPDFITRNLYVKNEPYKKDGTLKEDAINMIINGKKRPVTSFFNTAEQSDIVLLANGASYEIKDSGRNIKIANNIGAELMKLKEEEAAKEASINDEQIAKEKVLPVSLATFSKLLKSGVSPLRIAKTFGLDNYYFSNETRLAQVTLLIVNSGLSEEDQGKLFSIAESNYPKLVDFNQDKLPDESSKRVETKEVAVEVVKSPAA